MPRNSQKLKEAWTIKMGTGTYSTACETEKTSTLHKKTSVTYQGNSYRFVAFSSLFSSSLKKELWLIHTLITLEPTVLKHSNQVSELTAEWGLLCHRCMLYPVVDHSRPSFPPADSAKVFVFSKGCHHVSSGTFQRAPPAEELGRGLQAQSCPATPQFTVSLAADGSAQNLGTQMN